MLLVFFERKPNERTYGKFRFKRTDSLKTYGYLDIDLGKVMKFESSSPIFSWRIRHPRKVWAESALSPFGLT